MYDWAGHQNLHVGSICRQASHGCLERVGIPRAAAPAQQRLPGGCDARVNVHFSPRRLPRGGARAHTSDGRVLGVHALQWQGLACN